MFRQYAATLVSIGALCTLAAAEEYTDPAIALCEQATRLGRASDEVIIKIESQIVNSSVQVDYTISVLGTRPVNRKNICQFKLDPSIDSFVVSPIVTAVPSDCERRSAEYRDAEIAYYSPPQPPDASTSAAFAAAQARIDECIEAEANNAFEARRAEFLDGEWRGMAIYPIKASATQLRP